MLRSQPPFRCFRLRISAVVPRWEMFAKSSSYLVILTKQTDEDKPATSGRKSSETKLKDEMNIGLGERSGNAENSCNVIW